MRYPSHLFLRVEPALPAAIAAAARREGIGSSEFIRRAVRQALPANLRLTANDDREPPTPGAPAASMAAA